MEGGRGGKEDSLSCCLRAIPFPLPPQPEHQPRMSLETGIGMHTRSLGLEKLLSISYGRMCATLSEFRWYFGAVTF